MSETWLINEDIQPRPFPIMGYCGQKLGSIPWAVIAPHEPQAQRNHGQTLERLSERGGLSPCEAIAVLTDRDYYACHFRKVNGQTRAVLIEYYARYWKELRKLIQPVEAT